jgi:hypothetical protein
MKKLKFKFPALVCVLILVSSCTTIIFVEKPVPLPPEIELPDPVNNMVVQNYFDYTRDEYVKDKHEEVYRSAVLSFVDGLGSYLEGDRLINFIKGDTLARRIPGSLPSDFIFSDSVVAICNRYNANLMLAIDSVFIGLDWETEVVEDEESSYKVKNFYLEVKPFLSLYDSEGTLLDRSYVSREEFYKDRLALSGLITFKPSIEKAIEEVSVISTQAGTDYGSKFYPQKATYKYSVYYNEPFHNSYLMMMRGEWANAIRELLPLADSNDKKIAKRAANNLYVAYIGIGDETSAELWYEKANGKKEGAR